MPVKEERMKKVYVLLMLVAFCGWLAAVDVLLVNYTFSPEGEQLMHELQKYIEESDWTSLTNQEKGGDLCLFVKEYFIPKGIDPTLRNFTVTLTVVEEPFGDYSEYVPLDRTVSGTWYVGTESFILSSSDMKNGLWEAIERIDTELYLFLATYSNIIYQAGRTEWEERVDAIQALLEEYCAWSLAWYKTPRSQGGAGGEIHSGSLYSLSEFLGFDKASGSLMIDEYDIQIGILTFDPEYIELGASTLLNSPYKQEFYRGRVNLENGSIKFSIHSDVSDK